MTSCLYVNVFLMEYIWKTEQMREKVNKTIDDKPSNDKQVLREEELEEEEEEEEGEKCN